jgi:hypothetical protein
VISSRLPPESNSAFQEALAARSKYAEVIAVEWHGIERQGIGHGREIDSWLSISFAKIPCSGEEKSSPLASAPDTFPLAPLKYTFLPDAEDMVAVNRMRFRPGRWFKIAAMIVLPLAVFAAEAWRHSWIDTDELFALYAGLVFLPLYVIGLLAVKILLLVPRKCRRIFSQNQNMQQRITVEINEDDLAVTSPRGSTSLRWRDLYSLQANDRVIALFQSEAQCIILPARVFNNAEERREVLALIEGKLVRR